MIDRHNRRTVARLNRAWKRGELPMLSRDVGDGPKAAPVMRPACGTRHRRAPGRAAVRVRGSRRRAGSRAGPSGDPDQSDDPDPPGPSRWEAVKWGGTR